MKKKETSNRKLTGRIAVIAVCLLAMIPAALAYAGGGLLSGFPSSATVGDSVTWKVDPGDEEGDLKVSASGASVSVSGYSFTVKFTQAGTATIQASIGGASDSCSVSVKEAESQDSGEGDSGDEGDTGDTGDDSGDDGQKDDQKDDSKDDPDKQDPEQNGDGADKKGMPSGMKRPSGSMSFSSGAVAAGSAGGSADTTQSKTTYTGSADNYLEKLSVKGYDFTQDFHKTNDTYFLTVESGVESIDVTAEASDDDAEVIITGTDELTTGRNKVMVSVTAENGDVRVYRIYVDVK